MGDLVGQLGDFLQEFLHLFRFRTAVQGGHQLDPVLASDPRVLCLEHTHIRDVHLADLRLPDGTAPAQGFALILGFV